LKCNRKFLGELTLAQLQKSNTNMKSVIIFLIVSLILLTVYFRKDIIRFSEETSLPDQNPELVTYLQGDWAVTKDPKSVFRIKRDTISEFYNDTLRSAHNLYYVFSGAASKYFTNDSSFSFSSPNKQSLSTYDFKLKEVNNNMTIISWDTLIYVSRSRMDMILNGKRISVNRVK